MVPFSLGFRIWRSCASSGIFQKIHQGSFFIRVPLESLPHNHFCQRLNFLGMCICYDDISNANLTVIGSRNTREGVFGDSDAEKPSRTKMIRNKSDKYLYIDLYVIVEFL
jgi:hypothetical protein